MLLVFDDMRGQTEKQVYLLCFTYTVTETNPIYKIQYIFK